MLVLTHVGMVAVALIDGERLTKQLAWGALAVILVVYVFGWIRLQRDFVDLKELRRAAFVAAAALSVAHFAFGLVSVFCAAITLGLSLFASSTTRGVAGLVFCTIVLGYAGSALLIRLGLLSYRPLLPDRFEQPWQWDACVAIVLCLYAAAYHAGRVIRREMARIVREFEHAVREASYRDALFREARDALKQAAGIGSPGRFTDQELDGYRLGEVIGRGGMGEVYAASRREDGAPVAIKLLRLDRLGERSALRRFEREAAIARSIESAHVVRVVGVAESDAVLPYIAMERFAGKDLGGYLREHGRLPLEEVCEMVRQVADGLEAAHARNVVHRDLKPSNIFRALPGDGQTPVWKILDFGVSKLIDGLDVTLTANELIGTPQYMAPEQARGERELDARTDVYGLAAVSYRALTGEPPFAGELPQTLQRILHHMPAAPSACADLPTDVDLAIALGLAKQREHRLPTPSAFAAALAQAAGAQLDPPLRERARTLLSARPYGL